MTVKELKELLNKCDDKFEVVCAWGVEDDDGTTFEGLKIDPATEEVELWTEKLVGDC